MSDCDTSKFVLTVKTKTDDSKDQPPYSGGTANIKQYKYGGLETLFTFPPAAIDRNAVIEECAKAFDSCSEDVSMKPAYVAIALRAMKSQPAAPDPLGATTSRAGGETC